MTGHHTAAFQRLTIGRQLDFLSPSPTLQPIPKTGDAPFIPLMHLPLLYRTES